MFHALPPRGDYIRRHIINVPGRVWFHTEPGDLAGRPGFHQIGQAARAGGIMSL